MVPNGGLVVSADVEYKIRILFAVDQQETSICVLQTIKSIHEMPKLDFNPLALGTWSKAPTWQKSNLQRSIRLHLNETQDCSSKGQHPDCC